MTLAERIAEFSTQLTWDDLSPEAIDCAITAIADTVACASGAVGTPVVRQLREFAIARRSNTQSSLIGDCEQVDQALAALVNATAARELDANDIYAPAPGRSTGHFSDAIPALMAVAEAQRLSGRELILATVIAYEIQGALADSYLWLDRGLHPVSQVAWGVPPAAGRLMGLTASEIVNAIGLSGSTSGLVLNSWLKPSVSMPLVKGAAPGFVSRSALEATELAKAGFTAPSDALETLFDRLPSQNQPDYFSQLETRSAFAIQRTIVKHYPSQIYTQAAVEAAASLAPKISSPDDIALATVYGHRNLASGVQGSGSSYTPKTHQAADHSTPFVVAMALRDGKLDPASYDGEPWLEPDVLDLMQRIDLVIDPDLDSAFDTRGRLGCRLIVELANGSTLEAEIDQPAGHPDRPLTRDQLLTKMIGLTDRLHGEGTAARILDSAESLPTATSIDSLVAACRG